MALTTFTSGQVLTAAQLNAVQANDYNQTVSTKTASYTFVAADKGTRVVMNVASANTVTVNTSLFSAGDNLEISKHWRRRYNCYRWYCDCVKCWPVGYSTIRQRHTLFH
jgi:hypothetical protein